MIQTKTTPFILHPLPYESHALEPHVSERTLDYHHGKHHQSYVDKLNELVSENELAELTLEEIMAKTSGDCSNEVVFNNAAQVWNHNFYWNSLSPQGGEKTLSGALAQKIEISFGSQDLFIGEFAEAGMAQFGSGWVWLVKEGGVLKIIKTANAGNPISEGRGKALLALDVWEHAYYLDYQNRRNDYLATILRKLINWDFAAANFDGKSS